MNISTLIDKLQTIKKEHGYLEIFYDDGKQLDQVDLEYGDTYPTHWNMPDKLVLFY